MKIKLILICIFFIAGNIVVGQTSEDKSPLKITLNAQNGFYKTGNGYIVHGYLRQCVNYQNVVDQVAGNYGWVTYTYKDPLPLDLSNSNLQLQLDVNSKMKIRFTVNIALIKNTGNGKTFSLCDGCNSPKIFTEGDNNTTEYKSYTYDTKTVSNSATLFFSATKLIQDADPFYLLSIDIAQIPK